MDKVFLKSSKLTKVVNIFDFKKSGTNARSKHIFTISLYITVSICRSSSYMCVYVLIEKFVINKEKYNYLCFVTFRYKNIDVSVILHVPKLQTLLPKITRANPASRS